MVHKDNEGRPGCVLRRRVVQYVTYLDALMQQTLFHFQNPKIRESTCPYHCEFENAFVMSMIVGLAVLYRLPGLEVSGLLI